MSLPSLEEEEFKVSYSQHQSGWRTLAYSATGDLAALVTGRHVACGIPAGVHCVADVNAKGSHVVGAKRCTLVRER